MMLTRVARYPHADNRKRRRFARSVHHPLLQIIIISIIRQSTLTERRTPLPCPTDHAAILPYPLPRDTMQRFTLFALRRMAVHGIRDAHAASSFIASFGLHFRKPLVLMRAFIVELAQVAHGRIVVAPCCAPRMTEDEARIVGILATAASNPDCARQHLERLAGTRCTGGTLATAAAFNDAMAQHGRPLAI
jgi:hypothetical protein